MPQPSPVRNMLHISDMADLTLKVLKRVKSATPGAVFTPKAFVDLGNRDAVDQALSRLTKAGKIRRISRGVYDIPKTHPTLGPLSPDPDSVARAIAAQAGIGCSQHQRARQTYLALFTGTRADRLFD